MIAIVIRELTYLKILHPIMEEFIKNKVKFIVYHYDTSRGQKEYNRATRIGMEKSSSGVLKYASKIKSFNKDSLLIKQLKHDRITKLVSLEIWLWAKGYISQIKKLGIKLYSIMYLTDSLWSNEHGNITCMNRVYYSSSFIMNKQLQFTNTRKNSVRDKCIGSPAFDYIENKSGSSVLILLPNMNKEHISAAFKTEERFNKIIRTLCKDRDVIFKARKKQWIPQIVKDIGAEVIFDGDKMYPPKISSLFNSSHTVVMFWSSGIYESVLAGKYIVNINIPMSRWAWQRKKMSEYFISSGLYNFDGVCKTYSQDDIINNNFSILPINISQQKKWVDQFIGPHKNGSKNIVQDIINS